MGEKKAEAGEIIYREGDIADVTYTIVSGKVELLEISEGREVQTALREAGSVFGELAVFDPQAMRPRTARALEPCQFHTMTKDEFQVYFQQCPEPLQPILTVSCDKMKALKHKAKAVPTSAALEQDITKLTIIPLGEKLKNLVKPVELPIERLPFRIGGYPENGEISRRDQLHLAIPSQENPLRVSRQHCEITIENNAVVVTDLGSRFCTWVNGMMIGRGRGTYIGPLKKGENEVVLGAVDGPYKLSILCE